MTGPSSKNGFTNPNFTESGKLDAIHVGISGFPFGSAAINKCLAVYQSLYQHGIDFLIINNRSIHRPNIPVKLEKEGSTGNLRYVYTTPSPYKSDSFFRRRLSNLLGRINEFFLLFKLSAQNKIDVMFYYPTNGSFLELIYYRVFSKVFGFPLIAQYVEYRTAFKSDTKPHERLAHRLFDKYFMKFVDAVLPISEYLIEHLRSRGYKKPYIKVPPLTDFARFSMAAPDIQDNYFLYVGSAAYLDAIEFITQSFERTSHSGYELHLVVNGSPAQMKVVADLISRMNKKDQVKTFSSLKYSQLVEKYLQAKALLIPLTDTVQDRARFPQKISEYLASGNPIITTNYGEVPYYFKDEDNALVAASYDENEFAAKMDFVVQHADAARKIGTRGKETGLKFFDFNSYGAEIKRMILALQ